MSGSDRSGPAAKALTVDEGATRYHVLTSALRHHAGKVDGEVVNVNLIQLKRTKQDKQKAPADSAGGDPRRAAAQKLLGEYWTQLEQIIGSVGGGATVFGGVVTGARGDSPASVACHPWDVVVIVRYNSVSDYAKIISNPRFIQMRHLRRESVAESVMYTAQAVSAKAGEGEEDDDGRPRPVTPAAAFAKAVSRMISLATAGRPSTLIVATSPKAVPAAAEDVTRLDGKALLIGMAGHAPWRHFALVPGTELPDGLSGMWVALKLKGIAAGNLKDRQGVQLAAKL